MSGYRLKIENWHLISKRINLKNIPTNRCRINSVCQKKNIKKSLEQYLIFFKIMRVAC